MEERVCNSFTHQQCDLRPHLFIHSYTFSLYTPLFTAAGLSEADVVHMSVAVQAGLGLLQIPNLFVAHMIEKRYGLQITDRILSVFGSTLMTVSCLAIGLLLIGEPPANAQSLICFAFLLGGGAGMTYVHLTTVISTIMASKGGDIMRSAIAQLSLWFGVGAILFAILAEFWWIPQLGVANSFFIMACVYCAVGILRVTIVVRDGSNNDNDDDKEEIAGNIEQEQDDVSSSEQHDVLDSTPNTTHDNSKEEDSSRSLCSWFCQLTTNIMFILNSIVAGFGIGIGGTYLASLGYLPNQFNSAFGKRGTFWLVFLFFVGQTLARLITAILYAKSKSPYMMAMWVLPLTVGMAVLSFYSQGANGDAVLISCTIMISLGFGGLWSSWFVVAATTYPMNCPKMLSFAYTFLFVFIFTFVTGLFSTALQRVEHSTTFSYNAYFVQFVCFFAMSCVLLVLSLGMGRRIAKQ